MIYIKKSEKKNYHSYVREEAIQDLIYSIGEKGISNDQYQEYCELKGFLQPNRKSRSKKKTNNRK